MNLLVVLIRTGLDIGLIILGLVYLYAIVPFLMVFVPLLVVYIISIIWSESLPDDWDGS